LLDRNPGLLNKQDNHGRTGLMVAVLKRHHSLCRWLLSLPGLDTSLQKQYPAPENNCTALHQACIFGAPLDIVIALVRVSSWETVNIRGSLGLTALDYAVMGSNTSAALYLSWLGAECTEEFRFSEWEFGSRALKFWGKDASTQEKLSWAIAANISYMRPLSLEHDELDKEKLRALARLFNRHNICRMWGDPSTLLNLAWEKVWHSCPALRTDHRPDAVLPHLTPTSYHNTVNYLAN